MKAIIDTLALELTEKCNLDCHHCLKGESRDQFMSEEIVRKLFKETKMVNRLFFTGGEVMLAKREIEMVLRIAREENVDIYECEMFTNGTIYDESIYNLLSEYFQDKFYVGVSNDDYHDKSIRRIYQDNSYIAEENIKKHITNPHSSGFKDAEQVLINMGRARSLNKLKKEFNPIGYYYDFYKDYIMVGPTVFVSAKGFITDGNLEIDLYEENSLGNIMDDTLANILVNGAIKITSSDVKDFFDQINMLDYQQANGKGRALKYQDHKLVYKEKEKSPYEDALRESFDIFNEVIKAESEKENSGIEKILNYNFKFDHDLSQVDH